MGKHSARQAGDMPQVPVAAVTIAKPGSRRALREAHRAAHLADTAPAPVSSSQPSQPSPLASLSSVTSTFTQAPKTAVVTPSAPALHGSMSYAEYMNENLIGAHLDQVTVQVPRRFTGLFTRTRVVTATLAGAMLGMSGAAMAATGTPSSNTAQVAPIAEAAATPSVAKSVFMSVKVDGKTRTISAPDDATVGEALSEAGIYLGEHDEVSVSLSSTVRPDATISIARVTTKTVTEEFTEPYSTTEEETDSLKKGERKTVTEGKDGSGVRTLTVYYRDGKEISRDVVMQTVTTQPVNEVVQVGTRADVPSMTGRPITGSKTDWLAAAGISEADWGYADWLVQRESGWNPNAVNSSSGACGLAQALPCSKMGPNWNDPVTALTWMNSYVNNRYGGWSGAVAHSQSRGWY